MCTAQDVVNFNAVVQEAQDAAESFMWCGARSRRTVFSHSRTAHTDEVGATDNRVRTQESCTITVGTEERSEQLDSFWCGSRTIGARLGGGSFADVYECQWNDKTVIKIGSGHCKDGDIFADGWLDYARYVMNTGRVFILPKIHKLHVMPDIGLYVALLDRYEYCVAEDDTDNSELSTMKMEAIKYGIRQYSQADDAKCVKKYPQYYNAGIRVQRGLRRMGVTSFDIHGWNFMCTKSGRVILTDPCADYCTDETIQYLKTSLKEAA